MFFPDKCALDGSVNHALQDTKIRANYQVNDLRLSAPVTLIRFEFLADLVSLGFSHIMLLEKWPILSAHPGVPSNMYE